jgi:predicted secreted hydrolase
MAFELRDSGGTPTYRSGALIEASGASRSLDPDELGIDVLDRWTSPLGTNYPSRWRLSGPDGLELTLHPLVANQEHRGRSRYWEGAVEARCGSPSPCGYGYVELVGYAGSSAGARSWR